jgi:NADH-quinone oxidoreductase subunit L
MPITYATFLIGSLSLAGIFPFAGFWSKDEILGGAWGEDKLLFSVAMAVVFLTAFYTFRAVFLTFEGEYKGGEEPEHSSHETHDEHGSSRPHESPLVMALPLMILAVPAVAAGFVNIPTDAARGLAHLLEGALPESSHEALHHEEFNLTIAALSSALALGGSGLAYVVYVTKAVPAEQLQKLWGPVHTLVARKYYMDELYEQIVVRNVLYRGVCNGLQWFDTNVVDFTVNGAARATSWAGDRLRWMQSGSFQAYGTVGFAGLLVATFLMLVLVER